MIEILNKLKIFEYNRIQNFSNNIDLRKQVFLSSEKISERSCFVNKDVMQSFFLFFHPPGFLPVVGPTEW